MSTENLLELGRILFGSFVLLVVGLAILGGSVLVSLHS